LRVTCDRLDIIGRAEFSRRSRRERLQRCSKQSSRH
jgi:hypothetical protein